MKMGSGYLKFWENWKILDLGVVKILKKNRISSNKIPDSPPPRQGAFNPEFGVARSEEVEVN